MTDSDELSPGIANTAVDYLEYARRLRIVNVWQPGNPSGVVTNPVLYTPQQDEYGNWLYPPYRGVRHIIRHVTAGRNSLPWLAGVGQLEVSIHYLIPTDPYTVYKMIPDEHMCNHVGDAVFAGDDWLNSTSIGEEYENPADGGRTPITQSQYIKGALVTCNAQGRYHIPDWQETDHGLVALPWGRRSDPWAGGFDYDAYNAHKKAIRETPLVWAFWGMPMYDGR